MGNETFYGDGLIYCRNSLCDYSSEAPIEL